MGTTDNDLLRLTRGAQNNTDVSGWKTLHQFDSLAHTSTGFDAMVYQQGNTIVISMPGTNIIDARDFYNDFDIFNTKIPKQFSDAQTLYKSILKAYPNANIESTGYSLGATDSNLLSLATGIHSTAFSPIGSKHIADKYPDVFKYYDDNIRTYGVNGDRWFRSNLDRQSGEIFLLPELKQKTNLSYIGDFSTSLYSALELAKQIKSGLWESHNINNYPSFDQAQFLNNNSSLGSSISLEGYYQGYANDTDAFFHYSDDYKTFLKNQDYIDQLSYLSEPAYGLSYAHFNTYQKDPLDNDFINSLTDPYGVLSSTPSTMSTSNANSTSNDGLYIGGVIGALGTGIGIGAAMGSLGAEIGVGATAMGGAGIWAGITASGSSIGAAIAAIPAAIGPTIATVGAAIAAAGSSIWGAILGLLFFL